MSENATTGFKPYKRFLLSLGGLSSVTECLFALYGYLYLQYLLPPYGAAIAAALTAAAAAAIMPAVHSTVNRVRSLALGRYHGVLIVSSLLAPLASVVLFNIDPAGSMPYKAGMASASLFVLFVAVQTFSYAVYSITARVTDGEKPLGCYLMNLLGAAAVIGLSFVCFDFTPESIGRIAYILGAVTVLAGLSVYFSTYTLIPKFVRTQPSVFGLRDDYRRFFVRPLPAALCYTGRFFFTVAILAIALYAAVLVRFQWTDGVLFAAAIAIAAGGGVLARSLVRVRSRSAVLVTAIGAVVLYAVAFSALILLYVGSFDEQLAKILLCMAALAAGVSYGFTSAAQKGYMTAVARLTNTTAGTHKCMTGLLTCGATGLAAAICGITDAVCAGDSLFAAALFAVVTIACMIAGVVCSDRGSRYADRQPTPIYITGR